MIVRLVSLVLIQFSHRTFPQTFAWGWGVRGGEGRGTYMWLLVWDSLHHSLNCPPFSPCLSFLSPGLAPPNSLQTGPKTGCSEARENALQNGGRSFAKYLAACSCGGKSGPDSFVPRLPASCPASHPGYLVPALCVSGALQGELPLLMQVPFCQHFKCASSARRCSSNRFSPSRNKVEVFL